MLNPTNQPSHVVVVDDSFLEQEVHDAGSIDVIDHRLM